MTLTVRLSGIVEIVAAGLPTELRDRLRRTAAFANPEFYERERARLSTHSREWSPATRRPVSCCACRAGAWTPPAANSSARA